MMVRVVGAMRFTSKENYNLANFRCSEPSKLTDLDEHTTGNDSDKLVTPNLF